VKKYIVKDLMVPLSEYATVSEGATLLETLLALEKAQEEFQHTRYSHRAVLILDKNKHVIGKLSQLDFLRALEQENEHIEQINSISKFGFSPKAIIAFQEKHRIKSTPIEKTLLTAAKLKVEDFMRSPSEGEYIKESTSLDIAIHQFTTGLYISLLVTKGKDITGVLRLSDVFAAVFHAMKESDLKE